MAEETLSAGTVSLSVHPDTSKFSELLKGALNGESGNWQQLGVNLGKKLSEGAVAGVAAIGVASTKMAMDFQDSTTQLVTGAGESESAIASVRKGILAMAGSVGTAPQDLAKGMYMIESAGYHGAQGLDVLKAAAMGAKVGGADMTTVANALTTAMTDYNIPASRANATTSALVATVAAGKMHMEDLGNALGMVMPKASALGVSFADVNGALATMTASGMSARRASMNLSNTILSLGAPSAKTSDALKGIGLSAQQVKDDLGSKGLAATMQLIEEHVNNTFPKGSVESVKALKDIMGGTVGYGTALALTGTHMTAFEANVKSVGDALNGQNEKVQGSDLVKEDLKFKLDSLKASFSSIAIEIGNHLIPIIESVTGWLADHKGVVIALAAVIGGVMLTAMGMWVASLFAAGGALAFVMSPITLVVLAVAGLVAGVIYAYNHFAIFKQIVNDVWNWLKDAVVGTINFIKDHWELIIGIITGPVGIIVVELAKHWSAIYNGAKAIIGDVIDFFTKLPGEILDGLGDLSNLLLQAGKDIMGGLVKGIKSLVTAPLDAVKSAATGVLDGIKGFFGIHSPSTVMADVGANLMQGLTNGIVDNTDGTASAARRAMQTVADAKKTLQDSIDQTTQDSLLTQTQTAANTVADSLTSVLQTLTDTLNNLVDAIRGVSGLNSSSFTSGSLDSASTATRKKALANISSLPDLVTTGQDRMSENGGPGTPQLVVTGINRMSENGGNGTGTSANPATLPATSDDIMKLGETFKQALVDSQRSQSVFDRQGGL